jgi:hypothetical protein
MHSVTVTSWGVGLINTTTSSAYNEALNLSQLVVLYEITYEVAPWQAEKVLEIGGPLD